MREIKDKIRALEDPAYGQFQRKLIPTVPPEKIIGVRTPALRALAKELAGTGPADAFLQGLPHEMFEEDQLHAFLISGMKDIDQALAEVDRFLPYVDNWATCDQMSPRVFGRDPAAVLPRVRKWLASEHPYTIRFGIRMLMDHCLGENFRPEYPEMVVKVQKSPGYRDLAEGDRSPRYYVDMMIAWYFATALAKQYEAVCPVLTGRRLTRWTHNKTIQKAVESYRITPEQKEYLRTLRWK